MISFVAQKSNVSSWLQVISAFEETWISEEVNSCIAYSERGFSPESVLQCSFSSTRYHSYYSSFSWMSSPNWNTCIPLQTTTSQYPNSLRDLTTWPMTTTTQRACSSSTLLLKFSWTCDPIKSCEAVHKKYRLYPQFGWPRVCSLLKSHFFQDQRLKLWWVSEYCSARSSLYQCKEVGILRVQSICYL